MLLVLIISVTITVVVWWTAGPVWGVVTGILLIGGLGWRIALLPAVGIYNLMHPGATKFTRAFEQRFGEVRMGDRSTYPPPGFGLGLYKQWRLEEKKTGISADAYLDRIVRDLQAPTAQGVVHGLISAEGRWEGEAEALSDALLVTGKRIYWEGSAQREEASSYRAPWEIFSDAVWTDESTLSLKTKSGMPLLGVSLTGFGSEGPDPWLQALQDHGIRVTDQPKSTESHASP